MTVNAPTNGFACNITNQVQHASSHAWSHDTVGQFPSSDTHWA